jgi:hypothetical protein
VVVVNGAAVVVVNGAAVVVVNGASVVVVNGAAVVVVNGASVGLCQDSVPTLLVWSVGRAWGARSRWLGAQQHGLQGCRPRHELAPPFG